MHSKNCMCDDCFIKYLLSHTKIIEKELFWYKAKSFAYYLILYSIPCIFIAYKLGLKYEWSFIAGTIWLSFMPIIMRFFMKIF